MSEIAGPWYVASPTFYAGNNSGQYYHPAVVQIGNYAFLFAQGGQGSASTVPATVQGTFSPSNWCEGDKITLWRAPVTTAGLESAFTQIRLVSRCDTNSATRYHWAPSGAHKQALNGPVNIFAERQGIDKATGNQVDDSLWWYRGTLNAAGTDLQAWSLVKLFDVAPGVDRVGCCAIAADLTRGSAPSGRMYARGYGIRGQNLIEARLELSTTDQSFARIEFKHNGAWRAVANGILDFTPDIHLSNVRGRNIVNRGGTLELWGSVVYPTAPTNPPCPCGESNSSQNAWFTISGNQAGGNWSLAGPNLVVQSTPSPVRCQPASPAAVRNGADIVVLSGATYMFSTQQWEGIDPVDPNQPCPSGPFQGMDTVTTRLQ